MARYLVTKTPDQRFWAILDRHLMGFCTLPDDTDPECPNLLPLEWRSKEGGEAWLQQCYRLWESGKVPAPEDWRPFPKEESPFLRYLGRVTH